MKTAVRPSASNSLKIAIRFFQGINYNFKLSSSRKISGTSRIIIIIIIIIIIHKTGFFKAVISKC